MLVQIILILGYAFIVTLFIAGFTYLVKTYIKKPEAGKPFSYKDRHSRVSRPAGKYN
jgi:tetrahydromethanopterin S-methyltransferase subunit E